jgi:integrase
MARPGNRRRGGWRKKDGKIQVYVRVHEGNGEGPGLRTVTLPLDSTVEDRRKWIDDTVSDYRKKHPRGARGTLAGDVPTYLKLLVDRPALQRDRAFQLAWWCARDRGRFGNRARGSFTPVELETELNALLASGAAASTVKKYRTALFNVYTKLDGKNAPNPLRDVAPPREEDPLPRALPYDVIDLIFEHMRARRYTSKIDETTARRVYELARHPDANRSAIAKAHGLSETAVRKIVGRRGRRADVQASLMKAGLQVMAYVGVPPAQLRAIEPGDYDAAEPSLLVRGRKKGGGVRPERVPLTPRGAAAVAGYLAVVTERTRSEKCRPTFSTRSALRAWRSAIAAMCRALEGDEATRATGEQLRRELALAVPYDLRHSFLTEVQLAGGNIHATQRYALHADARMTRRYTLAAVAPELKSAAAALAFRRAGQLQEPRQRTGNESPNAVAGNVEKWPKSVAGKKRQERAKLQTKLRKSS